MKKVMLAAVAAAMALAVWISAGMWFTKKPENNTNSPEEVLQKLILLETRIQLARTQIEGGIDLRHTEAEVETIINSLNKESAKIEAEVNHTLESPIFKSLPPPLTVDEALSLDLGIE